MAATTETRWQHTFRVEAESPGFLFREESYYDVPERTVEAARAVLPNHVFRFRFYDAFLAEVEVEGERQTIRKSENYSPWHYLGGTIYTQDEMPAEHSILLLNMRANQWERVIHTPLGSWQPWEDDFVLVPV